MNKKQTFEEIKCKVEDWSKSRKIIPNAKSETQLLKAVSEMGELADATIKKDRCEQIDAVGDVLVCLVNYCALEELEIVDCFASSYEVIKDRKGTLLPNGVFVKEGE